MFDGRGMINILYDRMFDTILKYDALLHGFRSDVGIPVHSPLQEPTPFNVF